VSIGGFSGSFGMVRLASTCSRLKLPQARERARVSQERARETQGVDNYRRADLARRERVVASNARHDQVKSIEVERGAAVLQCIASDEKLLKALYKVKGDVPANLVMRLNDGTGAHIRTHAYKYDKLIRCAHQLETRCAHQLEMRI